MARAVKIQCIVVILFAALATGAQAPGSDVGRIEGIVLVAGTRMPLPQARVVLKTLLASQPARETLTNKNGAFAFDRVASSEFPYFVTAEREGYRQQDASFKTEETAPVRGEDSRSGTTGGSFAIEIRPGTRVYAEFQLTMAGAIAGTISDHRGGPLTAGSVELIRVNGNTVLPTIIPKRVATDSAGKYRFDDVLPGEYFVQASLARSGPRYDAYGRSNIGLHPDPLSATYYPGVSNRGQAGWVTVSPGSEFRAIDFLLTPPSPLRITGRIINTLAFDLESDPELAGYQRLGSRGERKPSGFGIDAATSYSFYLVPKDRPAAESLAIGPLPDYDDDAFRFELRNVPPGTYDLFTVFRPNTADGFKWYTYTGRSVIKMGDRDVTDLEIQIERNAEMAGRIVGHNAVPPRQRDSSGDKPTLTSVDPMPDMLRIDPMLQMLNFVKTDGSFQIPGGVSPGRYRVNMMQHTLPDGVYLDAARLDGANVLDAPFTIEPGSKHELVLELRADGGQLQGAVLDRDRRRVSGADVVLVPPDHQRDDPGAFRSVTTNARGEFSIEGIRPGSYSVFAFSKEVSPDSAFIERYQAQGRRIEVGKGKKVRSDLDVILLPW